MLQYLIMILACVLVLGALAVIVFWFFRRLRKIEIDLWGEEVFRQHHGKKKGEEP